MRGLWRDIRYGARLLVKARWFTLAAVTPLKLGIAATTTVFTLVNAVLLRGLPFNDSDRIMSVWTENERSQQRGISYLDYEDWRDQVSNLESFAAMLNANVNISDDEEAPERVFGAYVSANFFRMLGEQPFLGRDFTDDDDREGAPSVMILGHSVWENRYGADPGILGLTIRVNSLVSTVVGVMAPDMRFPFNTDVWIPRINLPPETRMSERIIRNFQGVGRLAPDASVEQARAELQALGRRLAEEYPESNRDFTPNLMGFNERMTGGQIRLLFLSLMGAVAFVLLIACANVANLLLARSADRAREMAVRVSLGATRWRVARQLLVENVLLAFLAGVAGLWLAVVGIRWFDASTQDIGKPSWMEFTMDGIVFAVMAAVCLATAILFGLAPALQVSKTDVNEVLKEGTRGGSGGVRARRLSGALIVGEVVLTLVLLSGAAFMMRSFLTMYSMDVGIETSQLVTMRLYLPLTQYPDPGPRAELYQNFEDRLAGIPRITGAIAGAPPLAGGPNLPLEVDGRVAEDGETLPQVTTVPVSDRYFDAVQIEALRGRLFSRSDGLPGSEAAIVNERFVEMHLPEGDPLGRFIRVQIGGPNPTDTTETPWLTVVGVTPNIRQRALEDPEPDPVVYLPLRANPVRGVTVIIRTPTDLATVIPQVQEAIRAVNPDLPFFRVMTMDQLLTQQRWTLRIFGTMFSVFAGIALILSAVGLYSVTAYAVSQRTREIGIRMALGAEPRQTLWLVLRKSLVQLAVAVPIGVAGSLAVGRLLESFLVRTSPTDPVTLVTIVVVLVGVSAVACLLPARRAARLDPMVALRIE